MPALLKKEDLWLKQYGRAPRPWQVSFSEKFLENFTNAFQKCPLSLIWSLDFENYFRQAFVKS